MLPPFLLSTTHAPASGVPAVSYSIASVGACMVGTFDSSYGLHLLGQSSSGSGCWPLSVPLVLTVPRAYEGLDECRKRNVTIPSLFQLLALHRWVFDSTVSLS